MDGDKIWIIPGSRVPNIVIGAIFALMFGGFAVVLSVSPFPWLAVAMGCVTVASACVCGYRRSVVLVPADSEVRIRHEVFLWKYDRRIPLTELLGIGIKRVITQTRHLAYRVMLVGLPKPVSILRKETEEEALKFQADVAAFLNLPALEEPL